MAADAGETDSPPQMPCGWTALGPTRWNPRREAPEGMRNRPVTESLAEAGSRRWGTHVWTTTTQATGFKIERTTFTNGKGRSSGSATTQTSGNTERTTTRDASGRTKGTATRCR